MIVELGISSRAKARRRKRRLIRLRRRKKLSKEIFVSKPKKRALVRRSVFAPVDFMRPVIPGTIMKMPGRKKTISRFVSPQRPALMPARRAPVLSPAAVLKTRKTPFKRFKKLNGDRGIIQTVKLIKALVEQYKKDIRIRELAGSIVRPFRSNKNKIKAIFKWIKKNIKYVRDIDGIETLHTPYKILRQGYGDCDDLATLSASLLKAVGYKVFYVVTSNRQDKRFNHIFLKVSDGRKKYNFDATINKFNRVRPGVTKRKILV